MNSTKSTQSADAMKDQEFKKIPLTDPHRRNVEKQKAIRPSLTFDPAKDLNEQRAAIREKFDELFCIPKKTVKSTAIVEYYDESDPRFDEYRFVFESEKDFFVPAHLVLPKKREGKIPLVICLQGHTTGMHVSLGREPYPSKEPIEIKGDRDFALQAIAHGYAALCIEQRGFGELSSNPDRKPCCHELVWQLAMMNQSLIGERLLDISSALDAVLSDFDCIDEAHIGIMGNSAGGTSSFYAACADERITAVMPSCCFCSFAESWGSLHHCDCGYVYGILPFMDMADLSLLIAPRPLVVVSGISDRINPHNAVEKEFARVEEIYRASGAEGRCRMITGPEGHRFYADPSWDTFDELFLSAENK